jgi:CubicO group peptidase (beta-lactamase class C family)
LLLGLILERATGMSVSEFMETRLWQPMGSEGDGSWSLDSEK